jgi:hypothetical protein
VACDTSAGAVYNSTSKTCECPVGQILLEKDLNGTYFATGSMCVECPVTDYVASGDPYTCQECSDETMERDTEGECQCPGTTTQVHSRS